MLAKFTPFDFEYATPESVGVDSAAIAEFEAEIREKNFRHQGYIIYKDGKIAASSVGAPYRFTDKRHVYSVSKTFTGTAIGIAVDEGLLTVEDSVISFFPDMLPENISENLKKMKIKHLLSMNTGQEYDTIYALNRAKSDWVKAFLARDVEREPGTFFCYNSGASYMLSAIITRLTGMTLLDYLRPRLFNPLGIDGVTWNESPDGVNLGGWGIHVSMMDMLKLGILYLNKGVFNGKRIVSEKWIEEATSFKSDSGVMKDPDWGSGYGYQLWMNSACGYRIDGAYGQYVIVSPEKNCVTVLISEVSGIIAGGIQGYLDIYWDKLYPSISEDAIEEKTPGDISVKPVLLPPKGMSEVKERRISFEENALGIRNIEIRPGDNGLVLNITGPWKYTCPVVCGFGEWEYNSLSHTPISSFPSPLTSAEIGEAAEIAAAYAVCDDKLVISLVFVTSPHGMTLTISDSEMTVTPTMDVEKTTVKII